MLRKCVKCGEEKELEKFRKRQIWFSHTCKLCYSSQYRTGKPNTGRFVKGEKKPKHSQILKELYASGKYNPRIGKKHSEETKKIISLKKKGVKLSDEARKNISAALRRRQIAYSNCRNGGKHLEWRKLIKERDGQCKKCGTKENLHAHHIIPWKESVEKRFDLENGITLCKSCHKKEDGCIPAGWNKGLPRSKEWCENLSKSLKGKKSWNKGIKKKNI